MPTHLPKETVVDMLASLFEKDPLGIVLIQANGSIIWMNPIAQEYLDTTQTALTNLLVGDEWEYFKSLLLEKQPFHFMFEAQGYIVIPQHYGESGTDWLIRLIPAASKEIDLLGMQTDLIQQRKLANLGRMMMEMAHELNNPLTAISMSTQLIAFCLDKLTQQLPPDAGACLDTIGLIRIESDKIQNSAQRATGLRHEVLSYSKPHELNLKAAEVSKLILTTLNNINQQPFFRNMQIETEFSEQSSTVLCDPIKIEQILYNLLKNAYEATNGQGHIWIREYCNANNVLIEIEDNGPGIPDAMLDKIFSPFITTKPRTGNGLGLNISQQIIHTHGGTFSVYNKPGSGACFQINFPTTRSNPQGHRA